MEYVILYVYCRVIMVLVLSIFFLHTIMRKKRILKWEDAPKDSQQTLKRLEKKINKWLKIVISFGFIIIWIGAVIPAVCDLKYIITENIPIVRGKVVQGSVGETDNMQQRIIAVRDEDTGMDVTVQVKSRAIYKNSYIEVSYLPNTEYGCILEVENGNNH